MTEPYQEHPEDAEAEEQLAEIMTADAENNGGDDVDSSALFRDLMMRRYRA
jgi:hypothetical protein